MKVLGYAVLGWFCAVALLSPAGAAEIRYIDAKAVDIRSVLANPPADGSAETKGEIETLLKLQASRTPEEVARAKSEEKFTPFAFADVVGPWFTAENLPQTSVLLEEALRETAAVYKAAKADWSRLRPPLQDPRLHPAIALPDDGSYPSGHSTRGTVIALVLAELAPDLKAKLEARGRQIGDDRLIGGVHFPSDVEAGRKLGNFLFAQFKASPEFQAQLAQAKAEFARVRPKN